MAGKGDRNTRVKKWKDYWEAPIWEILKQNNDNDSDTKQDHQSN